KNQFRGLFGCFSHHVRMDDGWQLRLDILKRDAEQKILAPLRMHGWKAAVDREVKPGEYIVMSAERGGKRLTFALLYSSATDNKVYQALQAEVDLIMFNGAPYHLQSFTQGITAPVRPADEFPVILVQWNRETSEGKFAPDEEAVATLDEGEEGDDHRVLLSETPIEAVWLRLRQFHSVRLAQGMIEGRAVRAGVPLSSEVLKDKAEGVAFALRNATDYFTASQTRNVSQRILNLYYGSMAFVFAEMLAAPMGPVTLAEIEDVTKKGHGLYTIDGATTDLQDIIVGAKRSGFMPYWMQFLGKDTAWLPKDAAKVSEQVHARPEGSWATLEELFARIPEIADLYIDIFKSPAGWLLPSHDTSANPGGFSSRQHERPTRTYAVLTDMSGRMTRNDVAAFPGPISEIKKLESKGRARRFRAAIDHAGLDVWWNALQVHRSPLGRTALIKPIFLNVNEYRALCFTVLYALSIVVRYRPSVWRRVQEGDLDHMRALIEAFLAVVERVLPEQFLLSVTDSRIYVKQPGSLF
ncbi:hypothetical protein KHC28_01265, partial [Ancylobacter sonchi]|uniref:YaaC family protein n=1 Tax=Ancylobacter sonchi TaxID=1937790 RepID=UPI001BD3A26E